MKEIYLITIKGDSDCCSIAVTDKRVFDWAIQCDNLSDDPAPDFIPMDEAYKEFPEDWTASEALWSVSEDYEHPVILLGEGDAWRY